MRRKKGFTLIELLVVIAIIAILAGILFPILTRARMKAHTAACISNMKQLGTAVQLYRDNNDSYLPQACNIWYIDYKNPGTYQYNYFDALHGYMKNTGVAICRAKPIHDIVGTLRKLWYYDPDVANPERTRWYGAVYTPSMWPKQKGLDPLIGPACLAHLPWSRGGDVVNPDNFNYKSLNCNRASEAIILFCMSGTWTCNWDDDNIRRAFPDGIAHGSHDRGTPALFADLHVKFVTYNQVGNL